MVMRIENIDFLLSDYTPRIISEDVVLYEVCFWIVLGWRGVILSLSCNLKPIDCFRPLLSNPIWLSRIYDPLRNNLRSFVLSWPWQTFLSFEGNAIEPKPRWETFMKSSSSKSFLWFVLSRTWWWESNFALVINVFDMNFEHADSAHAETEFFLWPVWAATFYVFTELIMEVVGSWAWCLLNFLRGFIVVKPIYRPKAFSCIRIPWFCVIIFFGRRRWLPSLFYRL